MHKTRKNASVLRKYTNNHKNKISIAPTYNRIYNSDNNVTFEKAQLLTCVEKKERVTYWRACWYMTACHEPRTKLEPIGMCSVAVELPFIRCCVLTKC